MIAEREVVITDPKLIMEHYEKSPYKTIQVEILNGCGVPGIAAKFTDFLRSHHVDVVQSTNAPHFEFEKSCLYARPDALESSRKIADLLGFTQSDSTRFKIDPEFPSSADIAVVIGKDYPVILPFHHYLDNQP